jgi:Domain of unknown function (DUF4304)
MRAGDLKGLPLTTDPHSVAQHLGHLELEALASAALSPQQAQQLVASTRAARQSLADDVARDEHASINMAALSLIGNHTTFLGRKPKIAKAWKRHVDPVLRAHGFIIDGCNYRRIRDGAVQAISLQSFPAGGSFVINLGLQPLALVVSDVGLVAEINCDIRARWSLDSRDIFWVTGGDPDLMDKTASAAAEFTEQHIEESFAELTHIVFDCERTEESSYGFVLHSNLDLVRQRLSDSRAQRG